jgi:hypothetical protein
MKKVIVAFALVLIFTLGFSLAFSAFPRIETVTKTETKTVTETVYIDKPIPIYINNTQIVYIPQVEYVNQTQIVYIDRNQTFYIDRIVNQTVYVDRIVYVNQTEYVPIYVPMKTTTNFAVTEYYHEFQSYPIWYESGLTVTYLGSVTAKDVTLTVTLLIEDSEVAERPENILYTDCYISGYILVKSFVYDLGEMQPNTSITVLTGERHVGENLSGTRFTGYTGYRLEPQKPTDYALNWWKVLGDRPALVPQYTIQSYGYIEA